MKPPGPDELLVLGREQREIRRLPATTVSARMGMSESVVTMWELGSRDTTLARLRIYYTVIGWEFAPELGPLRPNGLDPLMRHITRVREGLGMSRTALGDRAGVGASALSFLERGARTLTVARARLMINALVGWAEHHQVPVPDGAAMPTPARFACGCPTDVWLTCHRHGPGCRAVLDA